MWLYVDASNWRDATYAQKLHDTGWSVAEDAGGFRYVDSVVTDFYTPGARHLHDGGLDSMNTGALVRGLVAMFAVAGVLSGAAAQEATGTPAQQPAVAEGEPSTPAQMLASAKASLPAMDRSALTVRRQLTLAREQK